MTPETMEHAKKLELQRNMNTKYYRDLSASQVSSNNIEESNFSDNIFQRINEDHALTAHIAKIKTIQNINLEKVLINFLNSKFIIIIKTYI